MKLGKSSTLCIVSRRPGMCVNCRHSNQATVDRDEGQIACGISGEETAGEHFCHLKTIASPSGGPVEEYFFFERYNGENGTWERMQDRRLLAEDATPEQRKALKADRPFIAAGEEL